MRGPFFGNISNGARPVALTAALIAALAAPAAAVGSELATAEGTIAIREAGAGTRPPVCDELIVEARGALDNHLIARTRPEIDREGACRYALSVPAQAGVWLRARPVLAAPARYEPAIVGAGTLPARDDHRVSTRAVQLRFTVISPDTYFFAPGEQKTVPLSY